MSLIENRIKQVQNYRINNKSLLYILENEKYIKNKCFWGEEDGIVYFLVKDIYGNSEIPGSLLRVYKWLVEDQEIIAWNLSAMKLTPELALIQFNVNVIKNGGE